MPSWWSKSSSKDVKKKAGKESFIDTLHRKFKNTTDSKLNGRSGGSRKHCSDTISEKGSQSRAESRSPSPSKRVSRCQSFAERPLAQPLPLPCMHLATVGVVDSEIDVSPKSKLEKTSRSPLFIPLPKPGCIKTTDLDEDLARASVSSRSSIDSDDPADSRLRSPQAIYSDHGNKTVLSNTSTAMLKDQSSTVTKGNSSEAKKPSNISFGNLASPTSPKQRPLGTHVPNLQILHHSAVCCAPDSSMSSPSRSPMRVFGPEQAINSAFWAGKPYPDVSLLGYGHCSSPGSGYNSGHNSMGGDISGQLFWQQSRGSPEYSPIPSPRMSSPGPSSRAQSGAVTPVHPQAGGTAIDLHFIWPDDGKQQSHRLPLPPVSVSSPSPFSHSNSAALSPSVPRSPGRAENPVSPESRWKKGKLLGRGTFGHVYVGFNKYNQCESGEMCAIKEVTLFSDDAKSKESAKQLMQEIALLSRLQHPNIVQYYGTETDADRLYIYLEYVSGGSIYKLLQDYGQLGELAIRSYTQQILSGLSYLHSKSTVHRDIKGANILVDPNGRVKLADFGMAKHITGQSCPLSFKGSPYWMAPEVIKNSSGCNLAVDIWSLGCTVLEMATTKPPWSQFEGVAAMFKIGNSKDLPAMPDHLSDEGKDFVKLCLQRNPKDRPSAAQLLEHPFVKSAATLERPFPGLEPVDQSPAVVNGVKALGIGQARNFNPLDSERLVIHSSRALKTNSYASDIHIPRNISCPVSPIGSPLLNTMSPRMSPSPISSPRTTSGSSSPLTGGSAGAIPFNHWKQVYLQEGFGSTPKPSSGMNINGFSYHDCSPDLFRMQPSCHMFSELFPGENDVLGKQLGRPSLGELYDGQSVLADRVSRQLLRAHMEMEGSLDLSPKSPLPNWTNGI